MTPTAAPTKPPAPVCSEEDNSGDQITIDNDFLNRRHMVLRMGRLLVLRDKSREAERAKQSSLDEATRLYQKGWTATWAYPTKVLQCEANPACVTVSTVPRIAAIGEVNDEFDALVARLNTAARSRLTGKDLTRLSRLVSRDAAFAKEIDALSSALPRGSSSC
jgi:hypothetical protein